MISGRSHKRDGVGLTAEVSIVREHIAEQDLCIIAQSPFSLGFRPEIDQSFQPATKLWSNAMSGRLDIIMMWDLQRAEVGAHRLPRISTEYLQPAEVGECRLPRVAVLFLIVPRDRNLRKPALTDFRRP